MTVPLIIRGVVLGAITFVTATTGHQYTAGDLALAEDLAGRAALALDNARLYRAAMGQAAAEARATDAERAVQMRRKPVPTPRAAGADAEAGRREAEIAKLAAERANTARAEFLANMSHELRTPLNAIAGYVDLLTLGVRGALTDQQRYDVERIKRSQRHLLTLVNDVLNFASIGSVRFNTAAVPVAPMLDDATDLAGLHLATKGFKFARRCPDELQARTDPEKAKQVVLNLLANAIKFTPSGGSIMINCERRRDVIAILVADTGPGIPSDKLEVIFEPFVRLDSTFTRSTEGAGLGLSISRYLARAMGGDLVAETTVGRGATFCFFLPAAG